MLNKNKDVNLRYTLKKHQILRSKKEISEIFENGESIIEYPLKLIYQIKQVSPNEEKYNRFKILIIIPKKNIKKSAHRNTIKRKIKECFRLQQHSLKTSQNHIFLLIFIFLAKDKSKDTLLKIPLSIQKLIATLNSVE